MSERSERTRMRGKRLRAFRVRFERLFRVERSESGKVPADVVGESHLLRKRQ